MNCLTLRRLRRFVVLSLFLICAVPGVHAGDESLSRYAAPYLLKGVGARPRGMGNAFVALANDTQAIYYNPAGLAFLKFAGLGSMYSPQGQDQNLWSGEYFQPLGRFGGIGAGVIINEVGGIEGRADEFAPASEINSREGAVLLSYGYAPGEEWSLGVTAKYLFHRFGGLTDNGRGQAFDLGGKWLVTAVPGLTLGAAAQNLGGSFRWSTGRTDPVLFVFKSGVAYRAASWLTALLDMDIRGDKAVRWHAGVEATKSVMAFRAGADHDHPTFGFGLTNPKARVRLKFDYSFELDPKGLDDVNRFSFTVRF